MVTLIPFSPNLLYWNVSLYFVPIPQSFTNDIHGPHPIDICSLLLYCVTLFQYTKAFVCMYITFFILSPVHAYMYMYDCPLVHMLHVHVYFIKFA